MIKSFVIKETQNYNNQQELEYKKICDLLAKTINENLPNSENKIWHRHPVWFLDGNPTVRYSKLKAGIRLMFWSGVDFDEEKLEPGSGKFKYAYITYTSSDNIDTDDLKQWLKKSQEIQWDYKNIVKLKGELVRLK